MMLGRRNLSDVILAWYSGNLRDLRAVYAGA
jgi:hypothetical protein